MLGIILCWFVPMLYWVQTSNNPDLLAYKNNILFHQTGNRYINSWTHLKPWHYFFSNVIPLLWFPLYLFCFKKQFWRHAKQSSILSCLLTWILLVIIFFSCSPGKRGVYILPALPMLALVMGEYITQYSIKTWFSNALFIITKIITAVLFITAGLFFFNIKKITHVLGGNTQQFSYLLATLGLLWLILLYKQRKDFSLFAFGIIVVITNVAWSTWGYLLLNPIKTPAKKIMQTVVTMIGPQGELGLTRFKEQFLLFSSIPLTQFSYLARSSEQDKRAWQWMREKPNRYILTQAQNNLICFNQDLAIFIGKAHRQDWILLTSQSMQSQCTPANNNKNYSIVKRKPYA